MDALTGIPKFKSDLPYYTSRCLKLRTKKARLEPMILNPAQEYVHRKITEQRRATGAVRVIILKARQLGMSSLIAGRFYRRVHLFPQTYAVVVANKLTKASGLFGMYSRFDKNLPEDLRLPKDADARGKHLVYTTGSEIHVETAGDESAGRSNTINLLHGSELAFWPNAEETYVSLAQAVPDEDSEIVWESTANGIGNLFHVLWEGAISGDNDYMPIFIPWFIDPAYRIDVTEGERLTIERSTDPVERLGQDVGYEFDGEIVKLTPEQLMWRRQTIRNKLRGDKRKFRQEYPSTPEEAFLTTGAMFFPEEQLASYLATAKQVAPLMIGEPVWTGGGVMMRPVEYGSVKIWEWPKRESRYAIGADTATGKSAGQESLEDLFAERGGLDFSAAFVGDIDRRLIVASVHGRIPPEEFARTIEALGYLYSCKGVDVRRNPAFTGVERNHSSGETVLRILKDELYYPQMYFHTTINKRSNEVTVELGWPMRLDTRAPMLDDAAAAVRQEDVFIPDVGLIREMFTFTRADKTGRPEAMENLHDDRVIAFALLLQMFLWAPAPATPLPPAARVGSSPSGRYDYD